MCPERKLELLLLLVVVVWGGGKIAREERGRDTERERA